MKKLKRIGFYGVSGVGKTSILKEVNKISSNIIWLEGSKLVTDAFGSDLAEFKKLPEEKKYFYREKAIQNAFDLQLKEKKHIIIDGHLVFAKGVNEFENVMTSKDASFYTDYIYLKLPPEIILKRHKGDENKKRKYSLETIANWQEFELKELIFFCDNGGLNFSVLESPSLDKCVEFVFNYINH